MENITSIENITHIKSRFYYKFTLEENKKLLKLINIIPSLIMVENKTTIKSTLLKLGLSFHDILSYLINKEEIEMVYFFYTLNIYNRESILYLEVNNKIKDLKEYTINKNNFYKEFITYYGSYEKVKNENIDFNKKNKVIYSGFLDQNNEVIYETNYSIIDIVFNRIENNTNQRRTIEFVKLIFKHSNFNIKSYKYKVDIGSKKEELNLIEYLLYLYKEKQITIYYDLYLILKQKNPKIKIKSIS